MSERWPAPTDPISFESLCADLWGSIWGQSAQRNGRSGQPQAGVDVYGRVGNEWIGIQCKSRDELLRSKLTSSELVQEVEAARTFVPPLRRFVVATTGPADATVQQTARRLTEAHAEKGLFEVEVWSWSEIWAEINRRPGLLQVIGPVYWPRLFLLATEQRSQDQAEQIVRAIQAPLLPCGLFITLEIDATDEDLKRVYGDQVGFRDLPAPPIPADGRHFLRDFYLDVRNGAVEAAGFHRRHYPRYNILHRNVRHTVSRFDAARCKRRLSENEPLFQAPHVSLDFYSEGSRPLNDSHPTLILKSGPNSARLLASCALDNSVLVDYGFPQLSVSPPDATGFSVTSLRGSFLQLTLDFFFIAPILCLPEESWPRLHNLHVFFGSQRHVLTFSRDDLHDQVTRKNPKPIAGGDAVMPQIVFQREITPEMFEKRLFTVVENPD